MIEKHPSEAALQEFALDESKTEIMIVEHIRFCSQCQEQVAAGVFSNGHPGKTFF